MTIASIASSARLATPQAACAAVAGGRPFVAVLQSCQQPQGGTAQESIQGGMGQEGKTAGGTIQRETTQAGTTPGGTVQGTTAHGRGLALFQASENRTAGPAATAPAHHRQHPSQTRNSGDLADPTPAGTGPGAALAADMRRAVVAYTAVAG
jgi:hypothetical protein